MSSDFIFFLKFKTCTLTYKNLNCGVFFRQRTGGRTNSAMGSTSGNTTLKVRMPYFLFSNLMSCLHCMCFPPPKSDSEIKGDILFLGHYESEFDWSNETAKVN